MQQPKNFNNHLNRPEIEHKFRISTFHRPITIFSYSLDHLLRVKLSCREAHNKNKTSLTATKSGTRFRFNMAEST